MEKRYSYITPNDYDTAERNGINKGALEQRVRSHGWDIEKAITVPLRISKAFEPIWEKWQHAATENGVSKKLFHSRIRTRGWDEEEAATVPSLNKRRSTVFSESEIEQLDRIGVPISTARQRLRYGWLKDDAINTPILTQQEISERAKIGTRKHLKKVKVGNQ